MAQRFVNNSYIGCGVFLKTKSNWLFSVEGGYMFRDSIKDNTILSSISTSTGNVIDGNGMYGEVFLWERGYTAFAKMGKILPLLTLNHNSGPFVMAGIGFMEHKIKINVTDNTVPQLNEDYKKGYDKLSNGLALTESFGYMYYGKKKILNFFVAFDFIQGFTQSRRSYDFNLERYDDTKRFDTLWDIKVGWLINIYRYKVKKNYFYF
jgi:hypothetical protein